MKSLLENINDQITLLTSEIRLHNTHSAFTGLDCTLNGCITSFERDTLDKKFKEFKEIKPIQTQLSNWKHKVLAVFPEC